MIGSTMIQVMAIGALALIVLSFVGIACAWGLSRLMDRANAKALSAKGGWGSVVLMVQSEPLPAAIYYGARWLGICLLIGMLFSRAV